jgi:hypothetical protein
MKLWNVRATIRMTVEVDNVLIFEGCDIMHNDLRKDIALGWVGGADELFEIKTLILKFDTAVEYEFDDDVDEDYVRAYAEERLGDINEWDVNNMEWSFVDVFSVVAVDVDVLMVEVIDEY